MRYPVPIIRSEESTAHHVHGSTFHAYVAPSRGSAELCAWRVEVPAAQKGVAHRPTREELLFVLFGELTITINGDVGIVRAGDAVLVPANAEFTVDGGSDGAHAWVTTTPGLEAVLADGGRLSPPWAR